MLLSPKRIFLLSLGLALILTTLVILSRSRDSGESERDAYKYSEEEQRRAMARKHRKAQSNEAVNTRLSERPAANDPLSRKKKGEKGNRIGKPQLARIQRPAREEIDGMIFQKGSRDDSLTLGREQAQPCICENDQPNALDPHEKVGPGKEGSNGHFLPSRLQSFKPGSRFTSVVSTSSYDNMVTFLNHYCHSETHKTLCNRLIVVWTSDSSDVPQNLLGYSCSIPLHFKHHRKFQVVNRYNTYSEIDTNAVLSLEDTELLSDNEVTLGFQTWQQLPYKIVGFEAHGHKLTKQHTFRYIPISAEGQYSFITGKSIFIHRNYLDIFLQQAPASLLEFVQKNGTGEQMLLNAVVAHYLAEKEQPQSSGVLVYRKKHKQKLGPKKVSVEQNSVQELREYCLNAIAQAYGGMPLHFSSIMIVQATAE